MEQLTQPKSGEKFSWLEFLKKESIAATKLYFEPITITWSWLKKMFKRMRQ